MEVLEKRWKRDLYFRNNSKGRNKRSQGKGGYRNNEQKGGKGKGKKDPRGGLAMGGGTKGKSLKRSI